MGQLVTQLTGVGVAFLWTTVTAFILFKGIQLTIGLRVDAAEELEGLDMTEHGASAYPDFVIAGGHAGSSISGSGSAQSAPVIGLVKEAGL